MGRVVKFFDDASGHLPHEALSTAGIWEWDGNFQANAIEYNTTINAIGVTGGSGYTANRAPDFGNADHYIEFTVLTVSNPVGPAQACRLADRDNWLGLHICNAGAGNGQLFVQQTLSGSITSLSSNPAGTVAVNDVIRLECIGTNWEVFINDVSLDSGTIDSSLTSTRVGLLTNDNFASPWLPGFEAGIFTDDISGTAPVVFTLSTPDIGQVFGSGSTTFTFTPSATGFATSHISGSTTLTFDLSADIFGDGALVGATTLEFTPSGTISNFVTGSGTASFTFTPSATISNYALAQGNISLEFDLSGMASFCNDWPFRITSGSTLRNIGETSGRTTKFCY